MRRPRPVLRRHEVERSPKLLHGLTVRNVSLQRAGSFRWMPAEPSSVEHYVLETSGISRHPPTCAGFHPRLFARIASKLMCRPPLWHEGAGLPRSMRVSLSVRAD